MTCISGQSLSHDAECVIRARPDLRSFPRKRDPSTRNHGPSGSPLLRGRTEFGALPVPIPSATFPDSLVKQPRRHSGTARSTRRTRNPDACQVAISGFRVRAFSAPRNDRLFTCQTARRYADTAGRLANAPPPGFLFRRRVRLPFPPTRRREKPTADPHHPERTEGARDARGPERTQSWRGAQT